MGSGIPLSELYLALLKLQLKDALSISQQYEVFKAKKVEYLLEAVNALKARNRKLKLIRYALQAASEGDAEADIAPLGFTLEALERSRDQLEAVLRQQNLLRQTLERLRTQPHTYHGEDLELEWMNEEERAGASSSAVEKPSEQQENRDR